MDTIDIMEQLQAPFAANEIEWRAQNSGITASAKPYAMVLAYVTNRAIMNRLDQVVGIANWRNEYTKWGENSILCGLSLRLDNEWTTKFDGAEETQVEATKGGFSDAMKRAAVQWGIGRYLYNLSENWATCQIEQPRDSKNWTRIKTKTGESFWWKAPALPAWALPQDKNKSNPAVQDKEALAPQVAEPVTQSNASTENLLKFFDSLGVTQIDLEVATGAVIEEFAQEDFEQLRAVGRMMKNDKMSFEDALASSAERESK